MIGSKRKVISVIKELEKEGIPRSAFERIFAPMGLDIGAISPEEIAVAVVAEMIAVRRNPESQWRSINQVRLCERGFESPPEVNVASLILAGGASRRMGAAKALLDYRGETFLDRLIRIFGETCTSVTVVLGHDRSIEHRVIRAAQAKFVANPDYEKGQLTSLQCGLRAIPAEADAVIFTPVDYPAVDPATLRKMIAAAGTGRFVIPRWDGRHGHPVLFAAAAIPEFLNLPEDGEARSVVRRNIAHTVYVDVEDPGILRDVDDPKDYAELLEAAPPVR